MPGLVKRDAIVAFNMMPVKRGGSWRPGCYCPACERGKREQGGTEERENSQDSLTLLVYGFRGQCLRQRFQTWPTTSPSDTLVPGLDVPSKGGDETATVSSWLWVVGDAGASLG